MTKPQIIKKLYWWQSSILTTLAVLFFILGLGLVVLIDGWFSNHNYSNGSVLEVFNQRGFRTQVISIGCLLSLLLSLLLIAFKRFFSSKLLLVIALVLGMAYGQGWLIVNFGDDWGVLKTQRLVKVEGKVVDDPLFKPAKTTPSIRKSFSLEVQKLDGKAHNSLVRVSTYYPFTPQKGEVWQLVAEFHLTNQMEGSYPLWLWSQQTSAFARFVKEAKRLKPSPHPLSFKKKLSEKLEVWGENHSQTKGKVSEKEGVKNALALVKAVMLSDRSAMDDKLWQWFSQRGLNHLLAISGLHLSLVVGWVFMLVRLWFAIFPQFIHFLPLRQVQAIASIVLVSLYIVVIGLSVPTFRAFVMASLMLISYGLSRKVISWQNFCLAFIFLLITNPLFLASRSFWLSFYAVFLIIAFIQNQTIAPLNTAPQSHWFKKPLRRLWQFVCLTSVVSLGVLVLQGLFFDEIALSSWVHNLIAVPIFSFILMPLVLFNLATLSLSHLGVLTQFTQWLSQQITLLLFDGFDKFIHLLQIIPTWAISWNTINQKMVMISLLFALVISQLPKGMVSSHLERMIALGVISIVLVAFGFLMF